jgi:hypothetical protein
MSEERRQILDMLAEGKISVAEAEELLQAIETRAGPDFSARDAEEETTSSPRKFKYFHVVVEPKESSSKSGKKESVNIRIPIQMLRAGMKFGSIMPGAAKDKINRAFREKGFDFDLNDFKPGSLREIIDSLAEFTIDVDGEDERVSISLE